MDLRNYFLVLWAKYFNILQESINRTYYADPDRKHKIKLLGDEATVEAEIIPCHLLPHPFEYGVEVHQLAPRVLQIISLKPNEQFQLKMTLTFIHDNSEEEGNCRRVITFPTTLRIRTRDFATDNQYFFIHYRNSNTQRNCPSLFHNWLLETIKQKLDK